MINQNLFRYSIVPNSQFMQLLPRHPECLGDRTPEHVAVSQDVGTLCPVGLCDRHKGKTVITLNFRPVVIAVPVQRLNEFIQVLAGYEVHHADVEVLVLGQGCHRLDSLHGGPSQAPL